MCCSMLQPLGSSHHRQTKVMDRLPRLSSNSFTTLMYSIYSFRSNISIIISSSNNMPCHSTSPA